VKIDCGRFKFEVDVVGIVALVVALCGVTLYRNSINELIAALASRVSGSDDRL
jgi:hypothetical protein